MNQIGPRSAILLIILLVTSFCLAKAPPFYLSINESDNRNLENIENQLNKGASEKADRSNVSLANNEILFMMPLMSVAAERIDLFSRGDLYEDR
jgi:hypothetical protein